MLDLAEFCHVVIRPDKSEVSVVAYQVLVLHCCSWNAVK